jgi:WD40 repeat protein
VRHLFGHTKDVRAVAYLPDGRLVSGGSDRTVRVWGRHATEPSLTVKAAGPVYAVAAAPDGAAVAFAGRPPPRLDGNFATLVDPTTGEVVGKYAFQQEPPPPDDVFVQFFRRQGEPLPRVPLSVWSLSFSTDGRFLAAACRTPGGGNIPNGAGGVWWRRTEATDGLVAQPRINALRFAPTGTALAVTAERRAAVFRSPDDTEPAVSVPLTADWAEAVAFVPGQPTVVVGANSFLVVFDAAGAGKPRLIKTRFRVVTAVAPTPDGRSVVVGGKPGAVEVYDPHAGSLRAANDFGLGGVYDVAVAPDGLTFAVAGEKGLAVFDADDW